MSSNIIIDTLKTERLANQRLLWLVLNDLYDLRLFNRHNITYFGSKKSRATPAQCRSFLYSYTYLCKRLGLEQQKYFYTKPLSKIDRNRQLNAKIDELKELKDVGIILKKETFDHKVINRPGKVVVKDPEPVVSIVPYWDLVIEEFMEKLNRRVNHDYTMWQNQVLLKLPSYKDADGQKKRRKHWYIWETEVVTPETFFSEIEERVYDAEYVDSTLTKGDRVRWFKSLIKDMDIEIKLVMSFEEVQEIGDYISRCQLWEFFEYRHNETYNVIPMFIHALNRPDKERKKKKGGYVMVKRKVKNIRAICKVGVIKPDVKKLHVYNVERTIPHAMHSPKWVNHYRKYEVPNNQQIYIDHRWLIGEDMKINVESRYEKIISCLEEENDFNKYKLQLTSNYLKVTNAYQEYNYTRRVQVKEGIKSCSIIKQYPYNFRLSGYKLRLLDLIADKESNEGVIRLKNKTAYMLFGLNILEYCEYMTPSSFIEYAISNTLNSYITKKQIRTRKMLRKTGLKLLDNLFN